MRKEGRKRQYYEFADFRLYPHERLLEKNDVRVPLTPRVLDLLIVLVTHQGELVSKEELLDAVWADTVVEEGNLNRTISTLRKNLGSQANGSDLIETVPKMGYRFIAPVREIPDVNAGQSIASPGSRHFPTTWLLAAVGAVAVGVLIFYLFIPHRPVTANGMTRLTNSLAEDESPEWSPDGTKIAFVSNRDGAKNVYLMNADGSDVMRLTNGGEDDDPVWSPDGTKILFRSNRDGNPEIYIMNSNGSDQKRLTFNSVVDGGPARFSPDGKKIVFSRSAAKEGDAYYNFDIFTMNVDGSDVHQLTFDPEYDAGPHWSPDGTMIAFVSAREKNFDVFVMNADGSNQTNLTRDKENQSPNGWTPDGHQIFYNSGPSVKGEPAQLGLINADGSNRHLISSFTVKTNHISYSAVTKKLVFASPKDGNFEIYTMEAGSLLNK